LNRAESPGSNNSFCERLLAFIAVSMFLDFDLESVTPIALKTDFINFDMVKDEIDWSDAMMDDDTGRKNKINLQKK
jgi:hypothetical protein